MRYPLFPMAALGAVAVALAILSPAKVTADGAPVRARLLTGPEGGTYAALGKLLEARTPAGVKLEASPSDGSLGNLIMTSVGRTELSFVQADVLGFMREQPEYSGAMAKIAVVLPLWREEIHILVHRGAGINRLADLRGKRLNIGVGASGSSVSAAVLLQALGLVEEQLSIGQLTNDDALTALRARKIDAMLVTGGAPLPFLARLPKAEEETL